jgi:hypothetical protein
MAQPAMARCARTGHAVPATPLPQLKHGGQQGGEVVGDSILVLGKQLHHRTADQLNAVEVVVRLGDRGCA